MKHPAFALAALVLAGCTIEMQKAQPAAPPPAPAPAAPAPAPAPVAAPAATTPPSSGGSVGASGGTSVSTPVGSASASGGVSVSWGTWSASGGEKPTTECKPESKKELCYDAVDNNCNGQIDEGCPGYRTANNLMQFTIAWKVAVDLDLHVIGPDGKEVNFKARDSGTLVLDKDCSGMKNGVDNCPEGKVENVFFPADRAVLKGRYKVWIEMADSRGMKEAQIPFFFGGKVGAQTFFVPFFIANKKGERKAFEFDVI